MNLFNSLNLRKISIISKKQNLKIIYAFKTEIAKKNVSFFFFDQTILSFACNVEKFLASKNVEKLLKFVYFVYIFCLFC